MYVRIKTTPNSPRKSVQIVESVRKGDKVSQKIVRYVGIAMNDDELVQLRQLAESIKIKIEAEIHNREMLFSPEAMAKLAVESQENEKKRREITDEDYKVNLKNLKEEDRVVSGIHDVYGKLFDELGYGQVLENPSRNEGSIKLFRDIVLARIANPKSKRGSVAMLEEDFGISLNLDGVYRMMDKLNDEAVKGLNRISYETTKSLYPGPINVVFFDCTTVYFEAFEADELREQGYSKDMKFNEVQVLLALMVTQDGLPVGYEAFKGSTYEGHTLIPAIKKLKETYRIEQVVFVADSGLMSTENLEEMESQGIEYIVGARLKNRSQALQAQILNQANYTDIRAGYKIGKFTDQGKTFVVSYCAKRAQKDCKDRERAIEKLRIKVSQHKTPKDYLSNQGYKKYLKINDRATVELDEEKITQAAQWDGLLGVCTNTATLSPQDVLQKYTDLWQVEEAFRINKHDLKIRPVFHWKPSRVRAHLAIAFTSFSLVKFLEHRVKLQYKKLSPEVIRQSLIRVQTSILFDSSKKIRYALPSKLSLDAKKIYALLRIPRTSTPFILHKL
jgi:hypothetical protein